MSEISVILSADICIDASSDDELDFINESLDDVLSGMPVDCTDYYGYGNSIYITYEGISSDEAQQISELIREAVEDLLAGGE